MEKVVEKQFKVGDKIVVTPSFGRVHTYTITRVTKTMAIAEFKNSAGVKCSERFGINYKIDGNYVSLTRLPRELFIWDGNEYKIIES